MSASCSSETYPPSGVKRCESRCRCGASPKSLGPNPMENRSAMSPLFLQQCSVQVRINTQIPRANMP